MRYATEQRSDGSWLIYDAHKEEFCFDTQSRDQTLAERWAETFNAAYAAFRDEALSPRLPLPGERWVPRRKAMVVIALRNGVTTFDEVCRCYGLSRDELASWISAFERHGVPGLRVTRIQIYRDLESKETARQPGILRPGQYRQEAIAPALT